MSRIARAAQFATSAFAQGAGALQEAQRLFAPEAYLRAQTARYRGDLLKAQMGYDAAGGGRRNKYLHGRSTSANAELHVISRLRDNHRELVRNNPYASSAIRVLTNNLIGSGLLPRVICRDKGELDDALQKVITEWADSPMCDFDSTGNLYSLQSLAARSALESGDALIMPVFTKSKKNPLQLRVLEGDYLDHTKNGQIDTNRYAVLGVVFNKSHQRIGYYIYNRHPGDGATSLPESKFVSAEHCAHIFERLRPGQVRGVPRGVAAMTRIRSLDDYQDARLEAAKAAACLVGAVVDVDGSALGGTEPDILPEKLEPGMFPRLAAGQDIRFNTPPSVSGHAAYVTVEQQSISIAYGVPYELLTNDMAEANYSSARISQQEFSRNLETTRKTMIEPLLNERIGDWFKAAMTLHGVDMSCMRIEWTPPRRSLLDPSREVTPLVEEVRAGVKSLSTAIRESGREPSDVFAEIKQEREMLKEMGIILTSNAGQTTDYGQINTIKDDQGLAEDRE